MSFEILNKLKNERVFELERVKGSADIRFTEGCDFYFCLDLTPNEMRELGWELMRIASEGVPADLYA